MTSPFHVKQRPVSTLSPEADSVFSGISGWIWGDGTKDGSIVAVLWGHLTENSAPLKETISGRLGAPRGQRATFSAKNAAFVARCPFGVALPVAGCQPKGRGGRGVWVLFWCGRLRSLNSGWDGSFLGMS